MWRDIKIKDLPEGLRMLAFMEQEAQGNPPNGDIYLIETNELGGFRWDKSSQGELFWITQIKRVHNDLFESSKDYAS